LQLLEFSSKQLAPPHLSSLVSVLIRQFAVERSLFDGKSCSFSCSWSHSFITVFGIKLVSFSVRRATDRLHPSIAVFTFLWTPVFWKFPLEILTPFF
jgi:hypothetical protein